MMFSSSDCEVVQVFRGLPESGLEDLLCTLETHLKAQHPFVLWLAGDMGAGKTTLVRQLLRRWGLSESTPVISPTYTIVNDYNIESDSLAHSDLYRAEENFSMQELGLHELSAYRGLFLEWPQQSDQTEDWLAATHVLEIESPEPEKRDYRFLQVRER